MRCKTFSQGNRADGAEKKLRSVLDLTDETILKALKLKQAEVQMVWKQYFQLFNRQPLTWRLGSAIYASGRFDGIRFHSDKNPAGHCLLVFTERLKKGLSEIAVLADDGTIRERLP